ncbi:MAG: ribosome biogenesis GTPase Der [bacterium]|nr:ribosome biogenesis GTPase Der [bacterium]
MSKVALLGRPNVGKSTLFNRLLSGKHAFVDKEAGTTRDRNYAQAQWDGKTFTLIDTGGIRIREAGLAERIRIQAEIALMEADFVVLLLDGKAGIVPEDLEVLRLIRKKGKPFCLVVNKKDSLPYKIEDLADFSKLGCDAIPISATAGINIDTLLDELTKNIPKVAPQEEELTKIAIIGRPNAGKSSILNRILEKERSLVDKVAGTTRDTVSERFIYHDKTFLFLDTAGIRKKRSSKLEFACTRGAERSISGADVCWLIVDAEEGIGLVDKRLVNSTLDKGSCLILVVNKWDLAQQEPKANYQRWVESHLPFVSHLPIVFTSSLTGEGIKMLLKETEKLRRLYSMNVKTNTLNRLLSGIISTGPASTFRGRTLKLYYATQTGSKPPAFTLWVNNPSLATSNWLIYIKKALRAKLGLLSVPIRIYLKTS